MPDKREKVIEILAQYGENSMVKLVELTGIRRNDLFELIPKMKSEELVKIRSEGRERLVRLFSPKKSIDYFIRNYPKRLKHFRKSLEKEFKALEKNLPLVSDKLPLIKVKKREYVFSLDKKTNTRRYMGKTREGHGYIFKARPTAEKQFVKILDLLYKLYQESSALNFAESIIENPKLIKTLQKNSEKIIKEITDKISKMILKQDPNSIVYVNNRMRNVLYGLIFKATLKEEMEKA